VRYQELVPVPLFVGMSNLRPAEREAALRVWLRLCVAGDHELMHRLREAIARVARLRDPVVIFGEPGTGKELVSAAVHIGSPRAGKEWLVVTPRAGDTFRAEFFGHAKGAWTGAVGESEGQLAAMDGSSLVLDDVCGMDDVAQQELLRPLEYGRRRRLGETFEGRVDVRIIATTNRPLDAEVERGRFRQDLRDRLVVQSLVVPPLRERASDIPMLVAHFAKQCAAEGAPMKDFSPEAVHVLMRCRWPGNVRELRSVVRRAVAHSAGAIVQPDEVEKAMLPESQVLPSIASSAPSCSAPKLPSAARSVDRATTRKELESNAGNKSETARKLRISRSTVYRRLR